MGKGFGFGQCCRHFETWRRRKIILIESKAKCGYLKKLTCKGTLWQVFISLMSPTLLGFCLGGGWSSNFVGSEFQVYKLY
jgi:hypothetical protein